MADPTARALLAEVYADPDADEPRVVYADWCLAHGEPHGELIALQMARRERTAKLESVLRERELVKAHRHRWLAEIWDAVDQSSPRFERGFLAHVRAGGKFTARAMQPEWSTITSLELPDNADHWTAIVDELVRDPNKLPVLREVRAPTTAALARMPRDRIEHAGAFGPPDMLAHFFATDRFPRLRSIGITGSPADWAWLWPTSLGERITRVELTGPFPAKSPWLLPGRQLPSSLRELELRLPGGTALRFERTGDSFSRVDIIARGYSAVSAVHGALRIIPASLLHDVTVSVQQVLKRATATQVEGYIRRAHTKVEHYRLRVVP